MAIIPRSSNNDRLRENLNVLNMEPLSDYEMKLLDALQYLVESPVSKAMPY